MKTIPILLVLVLCLVGVQAEEKKPGKDKPAKDKPAAGKPEKDKPKKALDEVLNAKIRLLKNKEVELHYDLSKKDQLKDWFEDKPYRVEGQLKITLEHGSLKLKGVGTLQHKAIFKDKAKIVFDITPWFPRDLGAIVAEAGTSEQYTLFCLNDLYFQKWDGGTKPGHMICRFGIKDPSEPEGNRAFRYIARSMVPEIKAYAKIRVSAEKDGTSHTFEIADKSYQGKQVGRDFSELHIGMYVVKSTGVWNKIVVRGKLSPRWLKSVGAELRVLEPMKHEPAEATGPTPKDLAAMALLRRYRAGRVSLEEVAPILGDPGVVEDVRRDAAAALVETLDKKVVPKIVNHLYSEDLLTRELAAEVLKGLCGKTFGYSPKGPEESRRKAIQKLIKYIQKKPKDFGRG